MWADGRAASTESRLDACLRENLIVQSTIGIGVLRKVYLTASLLHCSGQGSRTNIKWMDRIERYARSAAFGAFPESEKATSSRRKSREPTLGGRVDVKEGHAT